MDASQRAWPRFTAAPETAAPPPRIPDGAWPRWGALSGPGRAISPPVPDPSPHPEPRPQPPAPPQPDPQPHPEPLPSPPPHEDPPPPVAGAPRAGAALVPVRRSYSTALVPAGQREVALLEVARAARRAAPMVAAAGIAAVAAMALFRRR